MVRKLTTEHKWLRHPAFYNAYPIRNEIAGMGAILEQGPLPYGDLFIDDYYGRVFDQESHIVSAKYGVSTRMRHYVTDTSLEVVDELRVPYRRIPVFNAPDLDVIRQVRAKLEAESRDYAILLRGQTRTHLIQREAEESIFFYGQERVSEPSFLPSHLRKVFDPLFLKCMWQSQAAILLHNIGHDIYHSVGPVAGDASLKELTSFRRSPAFILFALGIAQHYGLPSVGLDLTDRLDVASWFATRTITTDAAGRATISKAAINGDKSPTIFLFRCPKDAVFEYARTKPVAMPQGRPDHQGAWFGHVGWGAASNQLGSYLACAFRLSKDIQEQLNPGLDEELFPRPGSDRVLDFFMKMRSAKKYEGEAARALEGVYHT